MQNIFYVYGHFDGDGVCRYIGKGKARRAWSFGRRNKQWSNIFANKKPYVVIFQDNLSEQAAYDLEREMIADGEYKYTLCNVTSGGAGGKSELWDDDAKLRMSAIKKADPTRYWLGKKRDPEFMARVTAASMTPEAIEKRASKLRGRKHTQEHKDKISESGMGRVMSQETKDKISAAKKGRSNGLEGKKHSQERKAKLSAIMKERMKTDVKLIEALKNRKSAKTTKKAKAVLCIELDKIFRCAKDAALELGCSHKHIQACCVGRRKTHHGYRWTYAT